MFVLCRVLCCSVLDVVLLLFGCVSGVFCLFVFCLCLVVCLYLGGSGLFLLCLCVDVVCCLLSVCLCFV